MALIAEIIRDEVFANAVSLSGIERGLVQGPIQDLVNAVQQEVETKLQKFNSLTDFQQKRLLAQKSFLDNTALQNNFQQTGKEVRDALVDLAKLQAQQAANEINKALQIPLVSVSSPPSLFKALVNRTNIEGLPLFNYDKKDGTPGWWKKLERDTQQRIGQEIRKGILSGDTPQQMIQRVRGKRTKNGDFEGGVISATKREAEAITRTAVHKVTNEARRSVYEDNTDILEGVQSIGTLDQRTTEQCRAYDGLKWTIPQYQPQGHALPFWAPPRHFRCRSVIVPVVIGIEELDRKAKEKGLKINEEIRASNSGPVAVSKKMETGQDMEQWFAKQSKASQNEMIGVGKAEIWRNGRASLYQMVNAFGEPLTLSQLRDRVTNNTLLPAPQTTRKTKKFLEDLEIEKILAKQAAQSKKNLKYHNENKDQEWYGKVGGKKKGLTKAEYEAAKELKEIRKGAIGKEEEDPVVKVWGRYFGTPQTLSAVAQMRFIRADVDVKAATAAVNRAKAKASFQKDYDESVREYQKLMDLINTVSKPTQISSLRTFAKDGFDSYAKHSKQDKPVLLTKGGLKAKEDMKLKAIAKAERLGVEDVYLKAKGDTRDLIKSLQGIEEVNKKINALPMGDISKPMPDWAKAQAISWWDEEIEFYKKKGELTKLRYGKGLDPKAVAKQNALIDEAKAHVITLESAKAEWIKAREIKDSFLMEIKAEQGKQGAYLKAVIRLATSEEAKAKAFDAVIDLKQKEIIKWQDWDKTKTSFGPKQKGLLYAKIQAAQEVLDSAKAWKANWEKDLAGTKAQQIKSTNAKKTLTDAEEAERKAKQAAYKREYRKRKKAAQEAETAATLNPNQNPVVPDPQASTDPFVTKQTIIGENWTKVSGPKGSNDGGVFRDQLGNEYYVKFMKADRINSEIAASMMYEKMGMTTLSPTRGVINGKEAILTRYRTDLVDMTRDQFLDATFHQDQFMGMFHASVWTKNWDFVGLAYDNLRYDPVAKKIVMVDPGGSFQFRAQGEPKAFTKKGAISEYQTFRGPKNAESKAAIDGRLKKNVWDEAKGVEPLFRITDKDIENTLRASGFPESQIPEFKEVLMSRRDQIVDKYSLSPEFAETIRKGKSWDQALEKHFPYQAAAAKGLKTEYMPHVSVNPGTKNLEVSHDYSDISNVRYNNRKQVFSSESNDEVVASLAKINKKLPKKLQFDDEDLKIAEGIARSIMRQASGSASSDGSAFMKLMELKHRASTNPKVGYHNGAGSTEAVTAGKAKKAARAWATNMVSYNTSRHDKIQTLLFGNDRTSPEWQEFESVLKRAHRGYDSELYSWLSANPDKQEKLYGWLEERLELSRALDQNRLRRIHGFNYINVERGHNGAEEAANWNDATKTFHFNAATSTSISRFTFTNEPMRVTAQAKVSDVHFSFHYGKSRMHYFDGGEDEYILASRKYRARMLKNGIHQNWEAGVDWNIEDLD